MAAQNSDFRPAETRVPLAAGLARLIAALAALFFVVYVIAPLPVAHFAPLRDYAAVVDETGIKPGALYYTDVPQSSIAEMHNRGTIRHFVGR
jgi:hypothetical protein